MRPVLILLPVLGVSICLCCASVGRTQSDTRCSNTREFVDPVYGSKITELLSPGRNGHNLYYHRDPWNADNSYLLGIDSDSESRNWSVCSTTVADVLSSGCSRLTNTTGAWCGPPRP